MARYAGGTKAPGGYYWNVRRLVLTQVPEEGGILPGGASEHYRGISWVAALVLAPILGGLFVVLLPFVGFAMLGHYAWRRIVGGARESARDLAATVTPGWRPGEAHLTGRPGVPPPEGEVAAGGAGEEALREVSDEIAARRREEKNGQGD
jgi:hypothetical protein